VLVAAVGAHLAGDRHRERELRRRSDGERRADVVRGARRVEVARRRERRSPVVQGDHPAEGGNGEAGVIGHNVGERFHVFGSSGALLVTVLTGLALRRLLGVPGERSAERLTPIAYEVWSVWPAATGIALLA
jgi:hypothetical protein